MCTYYTSQTCTFYIWSKWRKCIVVQSTRYILIGFISGTFFEGIINWIIHIEDEVWLHGLFHVLNVRQDHFTLPSHSHPTPYPSVFSSQLCSPTLPINFSRWRSSGASKGSTWWMKQTTNQYDQEIDYFYFEAREDAGIKICERSFLGWFINMLIIIKYLPGLRTLDPPRTCLGEGKKNGRQF